MTLCKFCLYLPVVIRTTIIISNQKIVIMKTRTFFPQVIVAVFLMLFSTAAFSQHFSAPSTNQGAGQWTFFTAKATLDGVDLVAGDEIAIFDGNTCVGAFVLTQVCDTVNFFSNSWVAYEAAGSGTVGYTPGHSFSFHCWDASAQTEYTGGTYTWYGLIGDGYEADTFPSHNAYPWSYPMLEFSSGNAVSTNLDGTVMNFNGSDSIPNVIVTVTPGSFSTTTNASGYYQFTGLATGTYNIYFTPQSYQPFKPDSLTNVSISANSLTTQNMALDSLDGAIAGYVRNANGAGIDSVRVVAGSYVDTTNSSGYYSLPSVAIGDYSVNAVYIGTTGNYSPATQMTTVYSNQTTTLDFTLNVPPGVLSGVVRDGNNGGAVLSGVQVIAVGYDTTTTDVNGNYAFPLAPGTYSLTFTKTGYHDASASGLVVTSGNVTVSNKTLYSKHWTFESGDPFSDVWTIYLNNITGDGASQMKNGDEIAMFQLSDTTVEYNFTKIIQASGSYSTKAFVQTAVDPAPWNLSVGDYVRVYNTTTYDGTFKILSVSSTSPYGFVIDKAYSSDYNTAGHYKKQVYTMVGLTYLTGPVTNAGTSVPLVAFSVLSDGSTGYSAGDYYIFKLFIAGGSESEMQSVTWDSSTGYYDPSSATPPNVFPSGSQFSKMDIDFDVAPGNLTIVFNGGAQLVTNLRLYLIKGNDTISSNLFYNYHNTGHTYSNLDAGTYSISAYGDYYPHKVFTGIEVVTGATTVEDLTYDHNPNETQTITLHNGYQLISRRVGGYTLDMSDFFDNSGVDKSKLDFIRDDVPVTASIDHSSGDIWVDPSDLKWKIHKGYVVKMNADGESFSINSIPINYNVGISIQASAYNIISYFPSSNLAATTAFASLMTDDLEFIRDSYGNSITKVGGVWVDHIGTCSPGQGYIVKWGGSATTFHYPSSKKSATAGNEHLELQHFQFGNGNPLKPVYTIYVSGDMLEEGDEIAVFDGGVMVGARVIKSSTDELQNNVPLFTELFDGSAGYHAGDKITIKYWKASENKEYWMNFDNVTEATDSFAYHGTTFPTGDNRYSIFELFYSPAGIVDKLADVINIYPNPANGKVNISSPERIDNVKIYSLLGQQITDINPDNNIFVIDLSGFDPGLYFINMKVQGNVITKKLTVR